MKNCYPQYTTHKMKVWKMLGIDVWNRTKIISQIHPKNQNQINYLSRGWFEACNCRLYCIETAHNEDLAFLWTTNEAIP